VARFTGESLDFRWLAFCALLADLVDKPLALLIFKRSHSSQNVSHALWPNLLVLLLTWWRWPHLRPYTLAFNGHLLADRQWRKTETFWWPLYGWQRFWQFRFMNTPQAMLKVYLDIIRHHPNVWLTELLV
jgi:hypothetical protein